jgi:hypothetical protein
MLRMKQRRFTDQQLFSIRNHIPIIKVIESLLAVPSKTVQDVFRFRCPLCDGYNTAVKTSTNLARCFPCGKNFNPIDMVMQVRNMGFVESVELLLNYQTGISPVDKRLWCEDNELPVTNQLPAERKPCNYPIPIKDIIAHLIDSNNNNSRKSKPGYEKPSTQTLPSTGDIAKLERIVDSLSQQIKYLKNMQ